MNSDFLKISKKNYLRYYFFYVLLIAYCLFLLSSPAYAHILLTDGSIGAVVHVNPEDDPIIGEPASFFFEFKDKTNKFSPADCDCQYSLEQDGKILTSGDLFANTESPSLDNANFNYTFPEKGVYSVIITGKPKTNGGFQTFRLEDTIRVERGGVSESLSNSSANSNRFSLHTIHYVVFGIGAVIALVIVLAGRRKKPHE